MLLEQMYVCLWFFSFIDWFKFLYNCSENIWLITLKFIFGGIVLQSLTAYIHPQQHKVLNRSAVLCFGLWEARAQPKVLCGLASLLAFTMAIVQLHLNAYICIVVLCPWQDFCWTDHKKRTESLQGRAPHSHHGGLALITTWEPNLCFAGSGEWMLWPILPYWMDLL